MLFILRELQESLKDTHDTTVGPDDIHYQILKHLPIIALETLLNIFNAMWINGHFPDSWHEATVLPIPKPGKDPTNPSSYRPIALTSCLCKTFERMVNHRLVWYLENHGIISEYQSGFRKNDSQLIKSYDWNQLLSEENIWLLCILILRRHTTQHGNMA